MIKVAKSSHQLEAFFTVSTFTQLPTFKKLIRRNGSEYGRHLETGRKRISSSIRMKCILILSQLYYVDGFVMEYHKFVKNGAYKT